MNHSARKRFGQNFLHDESVIERIVGHVRAGENHRIVEIGPGQGALTSHLAQIDNRLVVIEIDRDLVAELGRLFENEHGIKIIAADALKVDFSALAASENKNLYIVGNLPYNISTPLIFHLLSHSTHIEHMIFMLQKEVVQRMCADKGSKDYGRLSVIIQYHFQVEKLFDVSPQAFRPVPKVTSSIVRLRPHDHIDHPAVDISLFSKIVSSAFGHRRKTLRNSLRDIVTDDELSTAGIDPQLRAENISLTEYVDLSNFVFHSREAKNAVHRNL